MYTYMKVFMSLNEKRSFKKLLDPDIGPDPQQNRVTCSTCYYQHFLNALSNYNFITITSQVVLQQTDKQIIAASWWNNNSINLIIIMRVSDCMSERFGL